MDAQEEDPTLTIDDRLGYPIVVAANVRQQLVQFLRACGRFVVLCDANRHVRTYAQSLTRGVRGRIDVIPVQLGEPRKRLATVERVLERLAACGADRETLVLGVGGGVASDLFGFAAATFMRGVPYAHVATSLVAMVDAAIGGKTGVDLDAGKNLAGVFRDPIAVFAHVDAMRTLAPKHVREGLAEIVKASIIEGGEFFEMLEWLSAHPSSRWPWARIVADSIAVKAAIVAEDHLEHGAREVLNLGHTFAHAYERASGYRVSHGAAVSVGLRAAGIMAQRLTGFDNGEHLRVATLLTLLGMPVRLELDPKTVYAAMSTDKKKRAGVLRFVLPRAIGDVEFGVRVPARTLLDTLARCTQLPGAADR